MSGSSSNADSDSTPPSSAPSELVAQLPSPFYPPSLSKRPLAEIDTNNEQRSLSRKFSALPPVPLEEQVKEVLPDDKNTPDNWIARDPRLIRLTGKHPFNVEPPIKDLLDEGFLTPSNLFFVRNHGAVPRVDQEAAKNWTLRVHGLVHQEITFTIRDLISRFETVTLPITLVCAGNRRKEQNVVAKSLGFSWGAAGLSTALFTGVYLSDILEACGTQKNAKHCIFEGIDKLPNGPYGTSQKLNWAKDRSKGMLVAWAMNGLPLEPDHGFPLRVVIPGQIGGRSVKWLSNIEISARESQHYLHFWDNKVLPNQYTADEARATKELWYDPKYIITELNTNSAIAYPDHDETIALDSLSTDASYTLKGYAYAGGGRRIQRVEVSFDEGNNWTLAKIIYPEDPYRSVCEANSIYGNLDLTDRDTCFAWCFWSYKVPVEKLKSSTSIAVRCMDESLAQQPADMYHNPTGMMNNWWFRIVIHNEDNRRLRFEHPTQAGTIPGGWMQRVKDAGQDPARPAFGQNAIPKVAKSVATEVSMVNGQVSRKITMQELEAHNKAEEPWFVVKGEVYDGTPFLENHPGGGESITIVAGEDCTEDFMSIHSTDAKTQLAAFHIGTLDTTSVSTAEKQAVNMDSAEFLHPKQWKPVELVNIKKVSPDTRIYRFALTRKDQPFGLPTGQHVFIRLRRKQKGTEVVQGELIQRAYTPVSFKSVGYVDFLVKIYLPNQAFPEGGAMTQAIEELEVGDKIELKGPLGSFTHLGKSEIKWKGKQRKVKEIGLVCGGTGITPIMQVLEGVFADRDDSTTECWVVNGNRNEHDILMREDLNRLLEVHGPSQRMRLHNTLSAPSSTWEHGRGRISLNVLKEHLPPPNADNIVCLCGPDAMQDTVKEALQILGWTKDQLVVF